MSDSSDTSAKESSSDKTISSPSRLSDINTATQETDCFDSTSRTSQSTQSTTTSYERLVSSTGLSTSSTQSGDETTADSIVEATTELTTDGTSDLQSDIASLSKNCRLKRMKSWKLGSSTSTMETSGSISINLPSSSRSSNVEIGEESDPDLVTQLRAELGNIPKILLSSDSTTEIPSTSGNIQTELRTINRLSHLTEEDSDEARSSLRSSKEDTSHDPRLVRGTSHYFSVSHIDDLSGMAASTSDQTVHLGTRENGIDRPNFREAYAKGYLRNWDKASSDDNINNATTQLDTLPVPAVNPELTQGSSSEDDTWVTRHLLEKEKEYKKAKIDDEIAHSMQWEMYQDVIDLSHTGELSDDIRLSETLQSSTSQIVTSLPGTSHAGTSQAGTSHAGTSQAGTSQLRISQNQPLQDGISQAGTSQPGRSQPPPKKHYKGAKRSRMQRRQSTPTEQITQTSQSNTEEITQTEQMSSQTVHASTSSGKKPAIWNIFRQKDKVSTAIPQEPVKRSIISQIKRILQGKQSVESEAKDASKVEKSDASAHLKAGSKKRYYHTLSAAQTRRSSNISRMMDIFQRRPSAQDDQAEIERRRKKSQVQQEQLLAAKERLRRAIEDDKEDTSKACIKQRKSDSSLTSQPTHRSLMTFYERRPSADSNRNLHVESFFEYQTCYNVMLSSTKIVSFDSKSTLLTLFTALVYHDLRSAPIWNSELKKYTGVVTVTDYINVLYNYYINSDPLIETMDQQIVEDWKDLQGDMVAPFTTIGPEDNLYKGVQAILTYGVHRLPVIDPENGNLLGFLTLRRVLKHFYGLLRNYTFPSYMKEKLKNLKVATLDNIVMIDHDVTMLAVFKKFIDYRVSSLPVLDSEGRLIDVFSKSDIFTLCKDKALQDLDVPIKTFKVCENRWYKGLNTCTLEDTFFGVVIKMVKDNLRRLIIVDTKSNDKVIGIISTSDVLKRLITNEEDDAMPGPSSEPPPGQVKRNYSSATTLSPKSSMGSSNDSRPLKD